MNTGIHKLSLGCCRLRSSATSQTRVAHRQAFFNKSASFQPELAPRLASPSIPSFPLNSTRTSLHQPQLFVGWQLAVFPPPQPPRLVVSSVPCFLTARTINCAATVIIKQLPLKRRIPRTCHSRIRYLPAPSTTSHDCRLFSAHIFLHRKPASVLIFVSSSSTTQRSDLPTCYASIEVPRRPHKEQTEPLRSLACSLPPSTHWRRYIPCCAASPTLSLRDRIYTGAIDPGF